MNRSTVEKLKRFKALVLDGDGVFFDGSETRTVDGRGEVSVSKTRYYPDSQGISLLRDLGILVFFATGEGEPLGSIVKKFNALPSVRTGDWKEVEIATNQSADDKVLSVRKWLDKYGLDWCDVAYIGDDLNDLRAMRHVREGGGLAVAPANATHHVMDISCLHLNKEGGHGAIREFAELVFDERGIDETTLRTS